MTPKLPTWLRTSATAFDWVISVSGWPAMRVGAATSGRRVAVGAIASGAACSS